MRACVLCLALVYLATAPAFADPLDGVEIKPEVDSDYSHDLYIQWSDEDGDCINTRHEVRAEECPDRMFGR